MTSTSQLLSSRAWRLALGGTLVLGLSACSMKDQEKSGVRQVAEKTQSDLEMKVIQSITEHVVVATYAHLRDETKELARLAEVLVANPTDENLKAVQTKWKEARVPWEATEGFLFGPVDSLGVDPAIDSWPLSKVDLDLILKERPNITADFVRGLGTDVQGFHTAEYLIFGDGEVTNTKPVSEMTAAQLSYLIAVTSVLAEQTEKLYQSWTVRHDPSVASSRPYSFYVLNPSLDNDFYPSRKAVLQEFVQGLIKIAVEVGKGKISDPLGGDLSSADPSLVESQFSWNSLIDFQNNMMSIRNVYLGGYRTRGVGLSDLVALKNPALDQKIKTQIDQAEKAIGDISGPQNMSFTQAIKTAEGRQRSLAAIDKIAELDATLTNELLPLFQ